MTWWSEPAPRTSRRLLSAGAVNGSARPARLLVDARRHRGFAPESEAPTTNPLEELAESLAEARKEAYRAGYEQARADLVSEAEAHHEELSSRVESALSAMTAACAEVLGARAEAVEVVASDAAELAFELVEALLGRELELSASITYDALRRALALVPEGEALVIRVHPDDLRTLQELVSSVSGSIPSACSVVPDDQVEPGGCVVDAGPCRVDAQLAPALERVREVLGATGRRTPTPSAPPRSRRSRGPGKPSGSRSVGGKEPL